MEFTAKQIAEIISGTIAGDPEVSVSKVSKIEEGEEGSLCFIANPKYASFINTTNASIIIVGKDVKPSEEIRSTLIKVEDPYTAFAKLLELYDKVKKRSPGISEKANISEGALIGDDVYIGEFVYIGSGVKIGNNVQIYPNCYIGNNVVINDECTLYPGVNIYDDCVIGKECTLHGGVIIGSDGFGFAPQNTRDYKKVPQTGNVILEDNVEVGSNTTIDRATLGSTIIRKGVKLDNLIQIAHNVEIGENTVIAAQTGISGSTKIGRNCMIGGQVGIIGHLTIADNVMIAAQSGVGASIKEAGKIVQGSPSFDIKEYRKAYVHFRKLNEIVARLEKIEKKKD